MRDFYGNRIPEPRLDPPEPEEPEFCRCQTCGRFLSPAIATHYEHPRGDYTVVGEYIKCPHCHPKGGMLLWADIIPHDTPEDNYAA